MDAGVRMVEAQRTLLIWLTDRTRVLAGRIYFSVGKLLAAAGGMLERRRV